MKKKSSSNLYCLKNEMIWIQNENKNLMEYIQILLIILLSPSIFAKVCRRHEETRSQTINIKVNLFNFPGFLELPLMVCRLLAISENRDKSFPTMGDINTIHILILLDHRFIAGFPEDAVVVSGGFHSEKPGIFKLDQKPWSLAEISPDCVVDDFVVLTTLCL